MKVLDCLTLELECAEAAVEALRSTCERKKLEMRRAELALDEAYRRLERARHAYGQQARKEE